MYDLVSAECTNYYNSVLEAQIGFTQEHMRQSRFKRVVDGKSDAIEIATFHRVLSQAFDVFLVSPSS